MKDEWRIYTMDELYDLNKSDVDVNVFAKPKFPTRRWNEIYTKVSTTNKKAIEQGIIKLKELGFKVRKRIDYESTKKHNGKKFYKIEIYDNNLDN